MRLDEILTLYRNVSDNVLIFLGRIGGHFGFCLLVRLHLIYIKLSFVDRPWDCILIDFLNRCMISISFCTGYDLRLLMWFSSSQQAQACRWEMGSLKFAMGLSLLSYESCRHASFFDLSKTLGRFLSFFSGSFKVFHCRLFSEVPPVFQLPKSFAFFNQTLISGHWILFFPFNLFQISLLFVFLLLF